MYNCVESPVGGMLMNNFPFHQVEAIPYKKYELRH